MSRLWSCLESVFRDIFIPASSLTSEGCSGGSGSLNCLLVGPKPSFLPQLLLGEVRSSASCRGASSPAVAVVRRLRACMPRRGGGGGACTGEAGGGGQGACGCDIAFSSLSRRSPTGLREDSSLRSRRSRRSLMPSCCRALEISSLSRPRSVSTRSIGGIFCKSCLRDPFGVFLQAPAPGLEGDSAPFSKSGHTARFPALRWRVWT
mmetsp:Transcript_89096/g.236709  ORF Transcript_89096/g.236709 Transcript_89096/m.236709 type:complete len:206 (+) Transcript_89096:951-1568(+)